jgi:hypothetical protein
VDEQTGQIQNIHESICTMHNQRKPKRVERKMARYSWQRQICLGEQMTTIMETPPHLTNNPNHNTYGRLIQSKLGHAHIGEYYKDFNIPEDPLCPCGETYQTCIHIITECPLYKEHRHILCDDKHNIILTDLFGTKKGIA